jgi:hypothetical protein
MLRSVALVKTDVSKKRIVSIIRVTRIGELGTTLDLTSNSRTLRTDCHPDEGGARFLRNVGSYKSHMPLTSQKTPFFIVTAVKTSNLILVLLCETKSTPRTILRPQGLSTLIDCNHLFRTGAHNLPACSTAPPSTTLPLATSPDSDHIHSTNFE